MLRQQVKTHFGPIQMSEYAFGFVSFPLLSALSWNHRTVFWFASCIGLGWVGSIVLLCQLSVIVCPMCPNENIREAKQMNPNKNNIVIQLSTRTKHLTPLKEVCAEMLCLFAFWNKTKQKIIIKEKNIKSAGNAQTYSFESAVNNWHGTNAATLQADSRSLSKCLLKRGPISLLWT